jgi:hypothetical protein
MKISGAAIGLSLLVLTAVPVSAVESSIKGASVASVEAIWTKIGDFCGIGNWHPAIEKCALSADGKTRTLSLRGGGTIVEKLEKRDDATHSYSYSIVEGPLPVANYTSTISVAKEKPRVRQSRGAVNMTPREPAIPTPRRQSTAYIRPASTRS